MVSLLSEFLSFFVPLELLGLLVTLWVLVMISVPVIRWIRGAGAERIGIVAGVIAQVSVVVAVLISSLGVWSIAIVLLVPILGWASETIGTRTGIPFGKYRYTEVLQPQVAHVPILIPLAWLMMMPPAWAVGFALAPDSQLLSWALAAAAFTAWDLYLDPQMVGWDFWRWDKKGAYQGIPVSNYVGWFLVSFTITAVVSLLSSAVGVTLHESLELKPLLIVFMITWILQFIGQFFFWKLRVSAAAGFVVMGVFVAALAVTM